MTPTFVVGGESSFVRTKIARQLSRHDMDVVGHWDWKRKRLVPIPKEAEAVFVVTDMCSHRINDRTVAEAQKRKLPIIYGQRKYAENQIAILPASQELTSSINAPPLTGLELVQLGTAVRKNPAMAASA